MVVDGVLQDPVKKHGQLVCRLVAIFFGKLAHGVLDYVQRDVIVPHGKKRDLVGAPFHFRQKIREFAARCQERFLFRVPPEGKHNLSKCGPVFHTIWIIA